MPIPQDYTIKAGRYKRDADGVVLYACNCPGSKLTIATLTANRDKYTPWPQAVQPKPAGGANAGKAV